MSSVYDYKLSTGLDWQGGGTGETPLKHTDAIVMTCTITPLPVLITQRFVFKAEMLHSVWITIGRELVNQRCWEIAAPQWSLVIFSGCQALRVLCKMSRPEDRSWRSVIAGYYEASFSLANIWILITGLKLPRKQIFHQIFYLSSLLLAKSTDQSIHAPAS